MVLGYEEQIISDLLDDPSGGLVVLSSGLPLHSLISSLLLLHSPSSGTLLLLSASDPQKSLILSSLRRLNPTLSPFSVPGEVPGDLPSHHRSSLYSSGAALFVTPRILIADLLTSRCPPSALAGVILLNAHRLSDTSTEAFIARILRAGNRSAYVRAFTDRPQAMLSGFAKAERIMKCLFVRKLHLWPRFHVLVSGDLERSPPEVVDVRVPMTAAMKGVQGAMLGAMDACLKELRRTNKVDVDDLTVENGLFKSFDEIVRRQLDPIWHTLGRKTRQLVYDLGTLRKLADYLVRYDAVTYLKYLDTLRASEGVRSVWIFADSSHKVFELSKKRVYKVTHSDGSAITSNIKVIGSSKKQAKAGNTSMKVESGASLQNTKEKYSSATMVLEEVLEEAPKWKVLRELLGEIEEERKRILPTEDGCTTAELGNVSDVVLVACKDERSCMQLEDCIKKGPKQVMQDEWQKYLLGKAELLGLQKRKKQKNQDPKGFGVLNGEVLAGSGENTRVTSTNKLENDVLLAVASKISNANGEEVAAGCKSESTNVKEGRQKGKGQKGMKSAQVSGKKSKIETVGINKIGEPILGTEDVKSTSNCPQDIMQVDDAVPFLQKHKDKHGRPGLDEAKPLPPVQFYALDSDQGILSELKPSVIVVYHPNMDFVREIEVYKAENPLMKLRVYFLFYEESTEVQKFEASIRRENAAFESLIRQKSLMMMPVDQDSGYSGSASSSALHTLVPQNSITRKAGGRKVEDREMQVIVDMREFMSSLPNVLHQKGMRIVPVVLEVGDYVLSPLICVERKSVSDLFQSFSSGRLYHQVETMSRYYQIPVLLIEFSQDKSFSFLSANDIGDDVSSSSIISKLSLLTIHFPRLRLVWSRSVHATAEIFASLKSNQDEPDEVKAIRVGVPSEDGVVENDVRAENYNTTAVEFLRRLPGVTDSNYRALMDGCKSLADLALLPIEDLAELMGGQKAARTLREFLDAKCPTIL